METENEQKKFFVKCPNDNKIVLVSQCFKCEKLFQVIQNENTVFIECQAGKITGIDPANI